MNVNIVDSTMNSSCGYLVGKHIKPKPDLELAYEIEI